MTWILVHFKSNLAKEDEDLFFISYEQTSLKSRIEALPKKTHNFLVITGTSLDDREEANERWRSSAFIVKWSS